MRFSGYPEFIKPSTDVDVRCLCGCRSQERSKRTSVDRCICVYRCRGTEPAESVVVDVRCLCGCRSQERSKRTSVDLCICVYRCRGMELAESIVVDVTCLFGCRSQERSKRTSVDLCICVYRCHGTEPAESMVGPLVCCSKREVKCFTDANSFLKPGVYLVFAMAFNHWSLGMLFMAMLLFGVMKIFSYH